MYDPKEDTVGIGALTSSATSPIIEVAIETPYIPRITIHDGSGQEIGRLEWPSGKFRFIGDAEESARLFFECVLKPLVDEYIERRLQEEK